MGVVRDPRPARWLAVPDLIGIVAGHVYYFLEDVQGYRLRAPLFLADALDAPGSVLRVSSRHIGMPSAATTGVAAVDAWATNA